MDRKQNQWALIGLGSASVLGLSWLFSRFRVETRLHVPNARGIVEADPAGLARAAGTSLEMYALASAMQSEEKTDKGRLAVGVATWNATHHNRSQIVPLLIPHGHFASQETGQYAATHHPPTARTLGLAAAILGEKVPDIVHGAVQWDTPKLQDHFHKLYLADPERYHHYRFSSKEIAQRRIKAGAHEVKVPGITETRFWAYT
jgi:hypothetical protein